MWFASKKIPHNLHFHGELTKPIRLLSPNVLLNLNEFIRPQSGFFYNLIRLQSGSGETQHQVHVHLM